MEEEFKNFGLRERVVLSLSKSDWNINKIIYADNYFISINLLEELLLKKTLCCGTIRSNRQGFLELKNDAKFERGDYDYMVSNTNIGAFKWKDNKIVHFASNFHSTEEVTVKQTQKDGTRKDIKCPSIIADYNKHMGGVDRADQLRATYGNTRKSFYAAHLAETEISTRNTRKSFNAAHLGGARACEAGFHPITPRRHDINKENNEERNLQRRKKPSTKKETNKENEASQRRRIHYLLHPKYYDNIIKAIQLRCGYNDGLFKSPTTASNCCTLLLKVKKILKCGAIKRPDEIAEKRYANFEYLLGKSQNHDITRQAQDNKTQFQRQKKEMEKLILY
ncbi:hypothetical protein JTB14_022119 [Gonioctena quinquepunctata]|nr:hypothetical protein JTB14_022119 [Gonioctena quinquepunctata]